MVSAAIHKEMEKEQVEYEFLSFANVPKETILHHFPHIYEHCLKHGYDILKEPIPIVPAQHYFMGGIHVDSNSQTTMPHLYAVGETSCNGVHGRNAWRATACWKALSLPAALPGISRAFLPQTDDPGRDCCKRMPCRGRAMRRIKRYIYINDIFNMKKEVYI